MESNWLKPHLAATIVVLFILVLNTGFARGNSFLTFSGHLLTVHVIRSDSVANSDSLKGLMRKTPLNIFNIELGGNAGWFSLNYERFLESGLGVRIGYGAMFIKDTFSQNKPDISASLVWLIMLCYHCPISPTSAYQFDAEGGMLALSFPHQATLWPFAGFSKIPTSSVGVRYLPYGWGFTARLTAIQFYQPKPFAIRWSIGLSLGVAF